MKFCSQCDNMYYISINENNTNELTYYCRNCKYQDSTISSEGVCIIDTHTEGSKNIHFNHIINKYTKLDPTLPRVRNIKCPNVECKSNNFDKEYVYPEVIYMRYDDADMKYVYICVVCDNMWNTTDHT